MSLGRILFVDDDQAFGAVVVDGLSRLGFTAEHAPNAAAALDRLSTLDVDVVLSDLRLPGMDGNELCRRLGELRPDLPVVVVTAFGSLELAVQAIRAGAYDFVTKPFEIEVIALVLERAVKHRRLRDEIRRLQHLEAGAMPPGKLLGESPAIQRLRDLIGRVAASDVTVLVTGESGSGKELVAQALHGASERRRNPFVAVNCAAMPETLLEAELFGHVKGAFTGAEQARPGLFSQAERGTLFLDEIGDLPLALQPKVLRALQERRVRPVGSDEERPVDVRLIAATHRDLEEAVAGGTFREDLLYRLKVIELEVPPLRARGNDVLLLAQHFLLEAARRHKKALDSIAVPAAEKLLAYDWNGNVRELANCIERAVVLSQHDRILVEDLPDKIREHRQSRIVLDSDDPEQLPSLEDVARRYVLRVMSAVGGNKRQAARVLGIDRKTLYRRLEAYGVEVGERETESGEG